MWLLNKLLQYDLRKKNTFIFVLVTYSAFHCAASAVTLQCPTGQTILVVEAHYGQYGYTSTQDDLKCKPPNPQYDCVERMEENAPGDWLIMKELCDGETSCTFVAQVGLMSTCVETIEAEFTDVLYQCLPGE